MQVVRRVLDFGRSCGHRPEFGGLHLYYRLECGGEVKCTAVPLKGIRMRDLPINEELIALGPVVYFQFHDARGGDHFLLSSPSAFTLPNRV